MNKFGENLTFKEILMLIVLFSVLVVPNCASPNQPTVNQTNPKPTATATGPTNSPFWIQPLPSGLPQPSVLSEAEWNRVTQIGRTDPEVAKQIQSNNIAETVRWWVGHYPGGGTWTGFDRDVVAGTVNAPKGLAYFPAIDFRYRSNTDRAAQIVGVDLETARVVFSQVHGLELPPKIPR